MGFQDAIAGLSLCVCAALSTTACTARTLTLHAPDITPTPARVATSVTVEPMATGDNVVGRYTPPGPSAVLTASLNAELAGRALHGGEPGGYSAQCALDRFAVRWRASVTEGDEMLVVYADLSCSALRLSDGAVVWRGELRGRACGADTNVLGSDANATQRLVDRVLADATREMASDLALRGLGLRGNPSARVFADEPQQRAVGGLDDFPFGPAALEENAAGVGRALQSVDDHDPSMRASAWNVVAMAAGPGDPWMAGAKLRLDEQPLVRFVQYKALARLGNDAAMNELIAAAKGEEEPLLAEFLRDSIASGGIGVARSHH